jgi:hypothetical protein
LGKAISAIEKENPNLIVLTLRENGGRRLLLKDEYD